MLRNIMKSVVLLSLCSGAILGGVDFSESRVGQVVSAEETAKTEFYSKGGAEFEAGTFKFNLQVGEQGQIRRPQDSPLKDFLYSFNMTVEDPSIISFDEQGNWVALKPGKTKIIADFPSGDNEQSRRFNEELQRNSVNLRVDEVAVVWEVTVVAADVPYVPMYRLYNPNNKEHFYTASKNERDTLVRIGWGKYEGVAWRAPKEGREVYRLYNPILKDHHYTMDQNEVKVLTTKHHWRNEGVAWYSDGSRPVYRLFHQGLTSGSHHYTMSENEVRVLQTRGWRYEGAAWYGEYEEVFE
ncbi:hypothetical protein [Streptococcus gallinaceus]|uniref:DUF5648 domain-containing protein n=1 Tax=Streptococcus gallinaceus TaxID=165758 RepID=A0ABV2JJV5_9STRE|nr:hypothetical protein [Streptococcus gallinaceus]MCP1638841.1 hypothetical protein [Streptococcus gallinaceus]MCP1769915.1 hypothetical protein [Streptococcus gallinaceus]